MFGFLVLITAAFAPDGANYYPQGSNYYSKSSANMKGYYGQGSYPHPYYHTEGSYYHTEGSHYHMEGSYGYTGPNVDSTSYYHPGSNGYYSGWHGAECTVDQKNDGCCTATPIFDYEPAWILTESGGGHWTSTQDYIRFDIADDYLCNGTAHETQQGIAELDFNFDHEVTISLEMNGMAESSYETFDLFVDGEKVVEVTAVDTADCWVNSCNMCVVNMPEQTYTLTPGSHHFKVNISTIDAYYHHGAWFEIRFKTEQSDSCHACSCPLETTTQMPADCPSPYQVPSGEGDGHCHWSCSEGTTPDHDVSECVCQEGLVETGVDELNRRICSAPGDDSCLDAHYACVNYEHCCANGGHEIGERESFCTEARNTQGADETLHCDLLLEGYDNEGHGIRSDLFDRYDENLDKILTKDDLLDMGLHMHIYDEILEGTGDSTLDLGDLESHTESYDAIWDAIVQTIKDLDYQKEGGEEGVVNMNDMQLIKDELQQATDNFNHWTTEYQKAANSLNNEFGNSENLSITFDELDNHAANAKQEFHDRIHGAFERLGGSEGSSVSSERLQRSKEGIALLLAAFEDLHNQGKAGVDKQTYFDKLDLIEGIVNEEEQVHEDALNQVLSGRNMEQDHEL